MVCLVPDLQKEKIYKKEKIFCVMQALRALDQERCKY